MAKVSFRTKRGKRVSFTTKPGRKGKRKLTAYQRFVGKAIRAEMKDVPKTKRTPAKARSAMKKAAKAWSSKTSKKK
jgi:hypothetical protein